MTSSNDKFIARVDKIVQKHRKHKTPYFSYVNGLKYYFLPEVFNPTYGKIGLLMFKFIEKIKIKKNDFCLDMGCGSGLFAIQLASRCKKVIAVDSSRIAIRCTRLNVKLHNLSDKIEVRKGNLFSVIKSNEKFNLIIANLPFVDERIAQFHKRGLLEKSLIDFGNKIIPSFLVEAPRYLKKNGKILLSFGNAGNVKLFTALTRALYRKKVVTKQQIKTHKYFVVALRPR